ncbi:hypothetical protein D3C87_1103440 [compost metagenome]
MLQTIGEIHESGRVASRQTIAAVLNVPLSKVDEHIKRLLEAGAVRRLMPGVFEPVEVMPDARAVSVTRLRGGWVKYEVGDEMMTITPEEERMLAMSVKGAADQFHALAAGRDLADQIADMRRRTSEMADREAAAQDRIADLEEQLRVLRGIPKQMRIDAPR